MAHLNRQPLGIIIGKVECAGIASDNLLDQLKNLNKERKWVVHNSNRQDGLSLYTDAGRDYFIRRICRFTESAIALQHLISEELLEYGERAGISRSEIEAVSKQQVRELKGEA